MKSADIGDGEVTAADISTDAVGASELQGVTKLIFASCPISLTNFIAGNVGSITCNVTGSQVGDHAITTFEAGTTAPGRHCIVPTSSLAQDGIVVVRYRNACSADVTTTFNAEMIIFKN